MEALVTEAAPYIGTSVVGVLLFWIGLFLTKRLPSPMEREILVREVTKRDEIIADKEDYIKKLVQELSDVADTVRTNVVPSMSNAVATWSRIEQEILMKRHEDAK